MCGVFEGLDHHPASVAKLPREAVSCSEVHCFREAVPVQIAGLVARGHKQEGGHHNGGGKGRCQMVRQFLAHL